MDKVTVSKDELLTTLRENREKHVRLYEEARTNYRGKVIQALSDRLTEIRGLEDRDLDKIDVHFDLPVPVSYVEQYDEAIAMLEWETEDVIILTQKDFNRFVRNKWEWAQHFAATSLSYTAQH